MVTVLKSPRTVGEINVIKENCLKSTEILSQTQHDSPSGISSGCSGFIKATLKEDQKNMVPMIAEFSMHHVESEDAVPQRRARGPRPLASGLPLFRLSFASSGKPACSSRCWESASGFYINGTPTFFVHVMPFNWIPQHPSDEASCDSGKAHHPRHLGHPCPEPLAPMTPGQSSQLLRYLGRSLEVGSQDIQRLPKVYPDYKHLSLKCGL